MLTTKIGNLLERRLDVLTVLFLLLFNAKGEFLAQAQEPLEFSIELAQDSMQGRITDIYVESWFNAQDFDTYIQRNKHIFDIKFVTCLVLVEMRFMNDLSNQERVNEKLREIGITPNVDYSAIIPIWTSSLRQVLLQKNLKWQDTAFGSFAFQNKKNIAFIEKVFGRKAVEIIMNQTRGLLQPLLKTYFTCY